MVWMTLCPQLSLLDFSLPRKSLDESSRRQKILHSETMSIMFVDGAEAPSTNIMDMVSPYAPGFALWNKLRSDCLDTQRSQGTHVNTPHPFSPASQRRVQMCVLQILVKELPL